MSSKKIITLDNLSTFKTKADAAYQPKNANLTSISGLSTSTTGLVKMTNGTASLDTSSYATTSYVDTAISNLPEPMVFKGTLGTGGTITSLPTAASSNEGFTYKVITAGTYNSQASKVGDVFVCAKTGTSTYDWIYIPAGDDVEDTWRGISVNGTSLLGNAISTGAVNFKNGSNVTITGSGSDITIAATDTTYESKTAAQNGTAVSLVTTGEKYTWNNKQDALTTQTAYTAVGSGSAIPVITTNTLGQVTAISTVSVSIPSVDQTYSASSTNAQSGTAVAGALANYLPLSAGSSKVLTGDLYFKDAYTYIKAISRDMSPYGMDFVFYIGKGETSNQSQWIMRVGLGGLELNTTYIKHSTYTLTLPSKTGTLATTADIPSTTTSVTSGSTACVTSGAVFTALGLNSGETGLVEATTSEINALFA